MIDRIREKMELIENINYLKEILDEEHIKMAKNAGKSIKDLFNSIDTESLIKKTTSKLPNDEHYEHLKKMASNVHKHLTNDSGYQSSHSNIKDSVSEHKNVKTPKELFSKLELYKHYVKEPANKDVHSEVLSKIGRRIEKFNKIRSLRGDH